MLIGTMSRNKKLCDEFTENFNFPEIQWDRIATPERIYRCDQPALGSDGAHKSKRLRDTRMHC